MDKTQFNEALVSLIEYAGANANHVSKKDVELHFKDILTDENMYGAIYAYLKESKITLDDVDDSEIPSTLNNTPSETNTSSENNTPSKTNASSENNTPSKTNALDSDFDVLTSSNVVESEEELEFLKMYENDMNNIKPLDESEKISLIKQLMEGDSLAMAQLTEGYLYLVHKIAYRYKGKGLTLGDLIQEGNIGLILSLPEYINASSDGCHIAQTSEDCDIAQTSKDCHIIPAFEAFIENKIKTAIEEAISMQISSERVGSHLADRMNSLDSLSRDLTEKLGHAPSVKELSEEMNISEDEVETIIRTSMNVLSVEQAEEER